MRNPAMRKPVIGVIPLYDEKRESLWMLPGYLDGLAEAGAIPVILPLHASVEELHQTDAMLDGYLFTGGQDVNPALYGEKPRSCCGAPCEERDLLEQRIYEIACGQDKPILGICRGIQLLNVLHGGSLYQDLAQEFPEKSGVEHHMTAPYDRTVHGVEIRRDSPLYRTLGKESLRVNSYHHQGVKRVGEGLQIMAVAEDGLVEALCRKDKRFVWALQWHPELIYQKDGDALKVFQAFVKACLPES